MTRIGRKMVGEEAADWNVLPPENLDEVSEQKQAEQRTQLEEMEEKLQQTRATRPRPKTTTT